MQIRSFLAAQWASLSSEHGDIIAAHWRLPYQPDSDTKLQVKGGLAVQHQRIDAHMHPFVIYLVEGFHSKFVKLVVLAFRYFAGRGPSKLQKLARGSRVLLTRTVTVTRI